MSKTLTAEVMAPDGTRHPTSAFRRKATVKEATALQQVYDAAGDPKAYLQGEQHIEVEKTDDGNVFWILEIPDGHQLVPKKSTG